MLDHHKTAADDLGPCQFHESSPGAVSADDVDGMIRDLAELNRPPVLAIFDMGRACARMTWNFCHPGKKVPWLIRLIEDRDLWRFVYPDTKSFSLWLRSHPYDFDTWTEIAEGLDDPQARPILFKIG